MTQETWTSVDNYINSLFVPSDDALEAALKASSDAGLPNIQVAPNQGKMISILAQSIGAKSILEIGTLGGYSTIWLARALPPDGRLVTLESDPHHARVARENLSRAGLSGKVEVVEGPALANLPAVAGPFDLVFIDADKGGYAAYFDELLPRVRPNGLLLVDNTLWSGRVVDADATDGDTAAIKAFNDKVAADDRVESYLLPVGDGVTLIRKR